MTEEAQAPEQSQEAQQAMWDEVAAENRNGESRVNESRATEKPPGPGNVNSAGDPIREIHDRLARFEASHNTLAGHIGGLKRSEQELRQLMAAANAATRKVDNAPTQAQVSQAISDPLEWAELKRQHPEWAHATERGMDARIEARINAHLAAQGSAFDQVAIDRMVAQRVAGETASVRAEMIDSHLDSIVSSGDWNREVQSPAFEAWLRVQRPEVQALGESAKMTDAAKLLRAYEASRARSNTASNLTQQRQQTLESASSAPRRGQQSAKAVSVDDMTPEQLWNFEAKQREQKRQRGY
jgi:hypothetical protein